ncbi:ABC transporter ATP-binding protein [Bergeyella porcorum]|uniref:ABC transporter ATP-binding protein n=1 Tax=Bergeyella porcorum TaxID=1735111 RepID=UPI0035E7E0B6
MNKEIKTEKYNFLGYFKYFKNILGNHIYVFILLNSLVGLLDGIGLTMFIPLLSVATDSSNANESLGKLKIVIDFLKNIGIEFNIVNILILMVLLFSTKGLINYLKTIYISKINIQATRNLRFKLIHGLGNLSYQGFTKMSVGRIQNHIYGEAARLINAMERYMNAMQFATMVITYMILAVISNWQFAIMVAAGGYFADFLYKYLSNLIRDYSRKQVNLGNDFNEVLIQSINYFKYLKATNYFTNYNKRLKNNIHLNDNYSYNITKLNSIMVNAREPIIITIIAIVVILQIKLLGGNLASILISLLLFYRCLGYLTNLQGAWAQFIQNSTAIESIDTILEEFKENEEPQNSTPVNRIKDIEVKNLSITFGNTPILRDINMNIPQRTSIAFVGESGAGKTTLANVICGLQIPHNGKVVVDGQSLYESDLNTYRSKIGYITQEPVIFNDSIFNNVTFWAEKTPATLEKFYKVMDMVSMKNFIENLENKEDSTLGNNGVLVSGGQKQRISIARELYKDVELLIMDEATSALDSETEKYIKDNIDMLHGKFTMIIIAHRLSTIKNVDTVYLLDKGEITGSGAFSELVQTSERFRKMVELQNL